MTAKASRKASATEWDPAQADAVTLAPPPAVGYFALPSSQMQPAGAAGLGHQISLLAQGNFMLAERAAEAGLASQLAQHEFLELAMEPIEQARGEESADGDTPPIGATFMLPELGPLEDFEEPDLYDVDDEPEWSEEAAADASVIDDAAPAEVAPVAAKGKSRKRAHVEDMYVLRPARGGRLDTVAGTQRAFKMLRRKDGATRIASNMWGELDFCERSKMERFEEVFRATKRIRVEEGSEAGSPSPGVALPVTSSPSPEGSPEPNGLHALEHDDYEEPDLYEADEETIPDGESASALAFTDTRSVNGSHPGADESRLRALLRYIEDTAGADGTVDMATLARGASRVTTAKAIVHVLQLAQRGDIMLSQPDGAFTRVVIAI